MFKPVIIVSGLSAECLDGVSGCLLNPQCNDGIPCDIYMQNIVYLKLILKGGGRVLQHSNRVLNAQF